METEKSETADYYISWAAQIGAAAMDVVSAKTDEFELRDGSVIYDFLSTSFQANFGHSHSPIVDRIQTQLTSMPIAVPRASFELKADVTKRFLQLLDLGEGKIFYTVSGAESIENALKIARQMTQRKKIMARQKSYHGATLGALSITGDWRNLPHYTCRETVRIPEPQDDPNGEALAKIMYDHRGTTAAIVIETISGTNGVAIPDAKWFDAVQSLCHKYEVMLILDEVLAGFGRTGTAFAFQHYPDLRPDMVCMAKGISGGYVPFGALWTSQAIADYYDSKVLSCGLTSYAHPLGLAALDGVLETFADQQFRSNLQACEILFAERLHTLLEKNIVKATRVKGMLAAIDFDCEAPTWEMGMRHGLHLFAKGNMNVLAPPLTTFPDRLSAAFDRYVDLLDSFKL